MATLSIVPDPDDDTADQSRPLPHSIQAEQQVLGAMMLSARAVAEVRQVLNGTEFYRPAHQVIWQAICALADRDAPTEPTAVATELGGRTLAKVGGGPYLHELLATTVSSVQAAYYAHQVADLAYRRAVITTGTRLIQLGHGIEEAADLRGTVTAEIRQLTMPDSHGWPDPTPLTTARDLPSFPIPALPDWIGEYAARLAEQTQTPPDLAGCLALAVLAVAGGGRVWVRTRAWKEPVNIFTVIALGPANRKSEVFAQMTAPIRAAERELREQIKPVIREKARLRKIAEADLERAEKGAMNAATKEARAQFLADADQAARELEEHQVPPLPKLFSDDATPEALTSLLAEQGGRMAVLSPEGEIFAIAAGRYAKSPNFAVLKQGHAGEHMRSDRTSRDAGEIESAHVTLGVCTQPDVLTGLADTPEFRGQGLLGRILYSVPTSLLGWRDPNPELVPSHIEQLYAATLTQLILDLYQLDEPVTLRFTEQGSDAVQTLLREVEPRFRPGNDLAHMPDWGGKLVGAIVRIAGLLHLAQHPRDWNRPITHHTVEAARQIGDYFTAHAKAAYDLIGADPQITDAREILNWITRTGTQRFTARDVVQALRPRFKKHADTEPGLRLLESHGWIRRLPSPPRTGGPGRTPATVFEAHPNAEALASTTVPEAPSDPTTPPVSHHPS